MLLKQSLSFSLDADRAGAAAEGQRSASLRHAFMEGAITNTHSPILSPKRRVLLAAATFSALMGVLVIVLHEATPPFQVVRVVSVICISLLVLAWCYFDSHERHQSFESRFRLVIVVFGLLALFIYLLKSRGLTQGLRSVGMALLFCAGMLMIMLMSAFVFASIFGLE
jgi:xanthine/uracil permease